MPYRVSDLEWRFELLPASDAESRWARAIKLLAQTAGRLRKANNVDNCTDMSSQTAEQCLSENTGAASANEHAPRFRR